MKDPPINFNHFSSINLFLLWRLHHSIPPLKIGLLVESIEQLSQDHPIMLDIFLKLSIYIEFGEHLKFLLQLHPVISAASHIDILDSTNTERSCEHEVLL